MSSSLDKTDCPICFSEIDKRAKKCPHCQSLQGGLRYFVPTIVLFVIIALACAIVFGSGSAFTTEDVPASKIGITSSKFFSTQHSQENSDTDDATSYAVVGKLKINYEHEVSNVELAVYIYNDEGELIDVARNHTSGPYAPGKEYAFKVQGFIKHLPYTSYANAKYEVEVFRASRTYNSKLIK